MQITAIGGMVGGFACIVISIIIGGGDIGGFIDMPSVFVTVGGMLCSTIVSFPMDDLKKLPKLFKFAISKSDINIQKDIDTIIGLAEIARREGLLALENATEGMKDPFIKNGILLILDGSDPELVKNIMETEVYFMADRHSVGIGMFSQMSAYSPAFGMIGTLIGLVNMLAELDNMEALGPSMAVALVTTFYGCILANLVFTPLSKQLAKRSEEEQLRKNIIIEGILSIQDGENPRVIRDKLVAFVSQDQANKITVGKSAKGN